MSPYATPAWVRATMDATMDREDEAMLRGGDAGGGLLLGKINADLGSINDALSSAAEAVRSFGEAVGGFAGLPVVASPYAPPGEIVLLRTPQGPRIVTSPEMRLTKEQVDRVAAMLLRERELADGRAAPAAAEPEPEPVRALAIGGKIGAPRRGTP